MKYIPVSEELRDSLKDLGKMGDTYTSVILGLMELSADRQRASVAMQRAGDPCAQEIPADKRLIDFAELENLKDKASACDREIQRRYAAQNERKELEATVRELEKKIKKLEEKGVSNLGKGGGVDG